LLHLLARHYGVLNICAYLPNEPKFDPHYFHALEQLGNRLADEYPYYLLGGIVFGWKVSQAAIDSKGL